MKMELPKDKFILDACCGARMMWFDKQHPNALYIDIREEEKGFVVSRPNREIKPDLKSDFRDLPFADNSFKLVVWDPPHLIGKNYSGALTKTFGQIIPDTFDYDYSKGFKELWRVLEDYGILIFKFNDYSISFKRVLKLFPVEPLFGNTVSTKKGKSTKWFTFMKIPENG